MKTDFFSNTYSRFILLVVLMLIKPNFIYSQNNQDTVKYTPYELLSSYYNQGFKPFAKRNFYVGLAFSLEDRKLTNTNDIFQQVIDGERLNYNILLKGGYYTGDFGMAGISFNYYQNKFQGEVFRNPDTLQSNSITRGFAIIPNFRSSVPLTKNNRLSFFTMLELRFGRSNTLSRNIKNIDEVEKIYGTDYNFRVGLSPGLTFFVMEAFALEVQLDVLGYELNVEESRLNNNEPSRVIRQNVDFNINLLSLQLGLAYYFGAKK
ncbi:hypothetical protein OO013_08110 [Mangrovivirga sp. M17]|uniref:Outer membrane protein beta-barrel domain-containing protein n=1 Tax=Mangrovivirga halotolerans TaxID=2993936 RepID=A0ABT3RPV3_9BACT|nr:hypothetical protein [Mangrovivirga halotolerans]MCX2743825.1 hypothetical protein [Mangrovivirga halotolerans]